MNDSVPPRANLPAGYDEVDPYENENIGEFPVWWKENIELFREHELRPYRPPRFSDGVLTPDIISELEEELDVTIRLKAVNPKFGDDWGIWIDDEEITEVARERTEEGRTVYEISSERFEEKVRQTNAEEYRE